MLTDETVGEAVQLDHVLDEAAVQVRLACRLEPGHTRSLLFVGKEGRRGQSNCKQEDSSKMYLWKAVPGALTVPSPFLFTKWQEYWYYSLGNNLEALL